MILTGCGNQQNPTPHSQFVKFSGQTMGTTWHVTCRDTSGKPLGEFIDSLLVGINDEVSTYIPSSVISRFNQADSSFAIAFDFEQLFLPDGNSPAPNWQSGQAHFVANYIAASDIFFQTNGYFDPTVMPLVNYWGFGYEPRKKHSLKDSAAVDSLLDLVGLDKVIRNEFGKSSRLVKSAPGVQLDFSAIAKGHAVDIIVLLLESMGVRDALVEIGGEVRAIGMSPRGAPWRIGISTPKEDAAQGDFERIVSLTNLSLATSGNYRNYYEIDGVKHSHTINPKTGFPEHNTLLSTSVFSKECRTADAWATAMMVVGLESAKALTLQNPSIESILIFGAPDGSTDVWESPGIQQILKATNH